MSNNLFKIEEVYLRKLAQNNVQDGNYTKICKNYRYVYKKLKNGVNVVKNLHVKPDTQSRLMIKHTTNIVGVLIKDELLKKTVNMN